MKEIQMVDLKSQYLNIKQEIDQAIHEVLNSAQFIRGTEVNQFENSLAKYLDVEHVISCANGTDALQIALMALGLKSGDEIITSSFSFVATIEVILLLQLKPVLVDVDPDTFNIDPEKIEKAITSKTKAIIPVHLFGQCANMNKIYEIATKHKLHIIEDTAQAIGSKCLLNDKYKFTGTIGQIGCTSFFPSKNLSCFGDGGAIFTKDNDLAKTIRSISNHGMSTRYYYDRVGVNSRLDTLQAAILNVKLKYLDSYNLARQKVAEYYDSRFFDHPKIKIPVRANYSTHVFHQYTLVTNEINRNNLQFFLKAKNIPSMIYYPLPLHLQQAYSNLGYNKGDFSVSESLCAKVISLPIHTELDEEQIKYITDNVLEFVNF